MIYKKEDTSVFCPIKAGRTASANCRTDCAWYNPDLLQCAVFGIYDELTGIEGQLSLVSDSIDRLRDIQEDEE